MPALEEFLRPFHVHFARSEATHALERYLTECALPSLRPDDAVERVRCLRREAIPIIGHLSISELSRADIRAVVNPIVARGRAPMARNTLGYLRAALGWCVAQDLLTANPAVGVANPDTRRPEQRQRARWLCPEEIGWYGRATEQMSESVFSPMLRLLLLSGVRRDECACAVWSEFNLEARTWTLPRHRTKNSNDFVIHLSDAALDVLRSIPTRERGGLLFTSDGRRPVAGFTHALRRLIKTMAEIAERPIEPFVLHDCRRTIATNLCELGFDAIVVDRLLNHAGAGTASAIARIYNRHSFAKERAAALDAWGRFVLAQAHPEASNVIELAAAR